MWYNCVGDNMRLKNIKGAKEAVLNNKYVIQNPSLNKGKFKGIFNNSNPIEIEIGMGKGNFIINKAKQNPDINFIGIEKYDSVLIRALEKITEDIPNLRFIRMDATDINDIFDKEISKIYLNFSDPWPKVRHEHRRLSSERFLKKYDLIFEDRNIIIMKTDNRKLFEYSVKSFNNYGYKIENLSFDLHNDGIDNIMTEYEAKFVSLGQVIYMIEVIK